MDTNGTSMRNINSPQGNFRKRASILSVCVLTSAGVFLSPSVAFAAEVALPPSPTATDRCGTANDTATIEAAAGVTWYQVVDGARVEVSPGVVPAGGLTAEFVAETAPGDNFPDGSTEQTYTLNYTDQPCVIANPPIFTDESGTANDTVEIPVTEGVQYFLDGVAVDAGVYVSAGDVIVEAVAQEGYELDPNSQSVFNFTFDADVIVAPAEPVIVDESGTENDTITIPTSEGVDYALNGSVVAAGTYPAIGTTTVEAIAQAGYELDPNATNNWVYNLNANVILTGAAEPVIVDESGTENDTITIPTTEGVDYLLNGEVVAAGTYPVAGAVNVEAVAQAGYEFDPNATTMWDYNINANVVVVLEAPVLVDESGTENDTFTIPAVEGVDFFVDGVLTTAGTYPITGTVNIQAIAQEGYEFGPDETTVWEFIASANVVVSPAEPVFVDASGTAEDIITIPAAEGVTYTLNGVPVTAGEYAGSGNVTVEAVPAEGYEFGADVTTVWNFAFGDAIFVTPAEPTFTDVFGTADDIVTIPEAEGVTYTLNGEAVVAGDYNVTGDVTVEAVAADGYALDADATATWNFAFTDEAAPVVVTPQAPTFNDLDGTANDTVTIPDTEGVTYMLNGALALPGEHQVSGNVTIEAVANEGYEFEAGATTTWAETFETTISATPQQPTINGNILTIPDVEGIQYFLNGEAVGPGEYTLTADAVVTAEALEGYAIPAGMDITWEMPVPDEAPVDETPVTTPITPITTPVIETEVPETFVPTPGVITPAVSTGGFGDDVIAEDVFIEDEELADTGANPGLMGLLGAGGLLTALGAGLTRFGRNKKA